MNRYIRVCCVFLLLFAQQAALTHGVWHLRHELPRQQRAALASIPAQQPADSLPALCKFDTAFNQVLGGAPCAAPPCALAEPCADASTPVLSALIAAETLTPRSRGPPAFL